MKRTRSWAIPTLAAVVGCLFAASIAAAQPVPNFSPGLESQIPPPVKGTFSVATPEIAIVIDHSASMLENISTGRGDFVTADVFVDNPDESCVQATGGCLCGDGNILEDPNRLRPNSDPDGNPEFFGNPYHLNLFCDDDTKYPPENGVGWLTPEIFDVNASPLPPDLLETEAQYFARVLPEIDSSGCPTGSCLGQATAKAIQFTAALETAFGNRDPSVNLPRMIEREPFPQAFPLPDGIKTPDDGIDDTALFPFDDVAMPYTPAENDPDPNDPQSFPYLDQAQIYNRPIRKQAPGASDGTAYRQSKLRSAVCAVAAFAGLDSSTSDCFDEDRLWTNAGGTTDEFFTQEVASKAKLGVFKTNQADPGWYAPISVAAPGRLELPFRVVDFYPPGTDPDDLGPLATCAAGDDQCQRSALFLAPEVRRQGLVGTTLYPDCLGLGRVADDGVGKAVAGSAGFESDLEDTLRDNFGIPGGVTPIAGVLRDLFNNSAALPADDAGAGGFWSNDLSDCSAQNALILITDGIDSCTGSRCTCTLLPAACDASYGAGNWTDDSSEARLPGFLALADPPVAPFEPACPTILAASMLADASLGIQTYVVGLDEGISDDTGEGQAAVGVKRKLAALAESGGTGTYYAASSYSGLVGTLQFIYKDIKNQSEALVTAGRFALGIAPSSTNLTDIVIDAAFQPNSWLGFLRAQEIILSGLPLFLWEAGQKLEDRDIDSADDPRRIYTAMDKNCDGVIGPAAGGYLGDQEVVRFDLFWDEAESGWNTDLLQPGGRYSSGVGNCTGTPRLCLDNTHSTGAPFFLNTDTTNPGVGYDQTNGLQRITCQGAVGSGQEGLQITNRDGTTSALVSWVTGYDDPTTNPDCVAGGYAASTAPECANATPPYRTRDHDADGIPWRLGDIVGSSPVVVGPSRTVFPFDTDSDNDGISDFLEFQQAVRNRPRVVYVGSNDGMVHAFNVDGDDTIKVRGVGVLNKGGDEPGGEVFAFVPHAVLPRLKRLANPSYGTTTPGEWVHEASVDLTPRVFDAKIHDPGTDGPPLWGWRTILVIGGRGGDKFYLTLDVTDPTETIARGVGVDNYPTMLWEFTEFDDDALDAQGDVLASASDPLDCDGSPANEKTNNEWCEDNGLDDTWEDRLGETWSFPVVGRQKGSAKWALWTVSGPDTRLNPTDVAGGNDDNNDLHGFLWALDAGTGEVLDLGDGAGSPLDVTDACITTAKQDNNAGPIDVGNDVSPFRTSPVGADVKASDDQTTLGPVLDVLYWGDLGGRLWRGKIVSNGAVATSIAFQPEGAANCNSIDEERPITGTPSLTLFSTPQAGGFPKLWVFFSDGAIDFDSRDESKNNYPRDEFTDGSTTEKAYRIYGILDDPDPSVAGTRANDQNDENDCPQPGGTFTQCGLGEDPPAGGDLHDRTLCCTEAEPNCAPLAFPADKGFFVCLQTDPDLLPMDVTVPLTEGKAIGRGRAVGSAAVAAGTVLAEVFTPLASTSSMCFEGGSTRIVAFDFNSGANSNWTVRGGAESAGTDSKYYVPPENPVTGVDAAQAPTPIPPPGAKPDFLRYEAITGPSDEGPAAPPIPLDTIYWREVF